MFGTIVASSERGLVFGNRGILHDDERRIVRSTQVKRWIACRLAFRNYRRRAIMRPHSYTELFFLDEATAFSAGHRPCAECRRADYNRFRTLWELVTGAPAGADAMDAQLHAERLDGKAKRTYRAQLSDLPDGTCIVYEGTPWLVVDDHLLAWSLAGYHERRPRPNSVIDVLTPRTIVAIFAAGYRPLIHPDPIPPEGG